MQILSDCHTKIAILHSLRSSVPAQVLVEWMDTRARRELVLAVLLCFENDIVQSLLADFNVAHLKRLMALSSKTNMLARARSARKRALHLFYRDIAAAEFAYSPLGLRLQEPSWLAELSSAQILRLMLNIPTELRAALLSCFAPLRVSKAVLLCDADPEKQKLMTALQAINLVSEDDLDNLLQFLDSKGKKFAQRHLDASNTTRYLGAVISNLSKDDSYRMLTELQDKPQLLHELRRHFLSFENIANLETQEVAAIFAERRERDIAYILFNTDTLTRDTVLNTFGEATRLGVQEELRQLEADKQRRSANLHLSARLQLEVRNYLQSRAGDMLRANDRDAEITPRAETGRPTT